MTETLKGCDLLSFNFSVKPLVGNRSRRQVATLVTFGCVYNKDQSDRPVSKKRGRGRDWACGQQFTYSWPLTEVKRTD